MSSLEAVSALLIDLSSRIDTARGLYQLFINRRVSEHCNDASFCLRDIDSIYESVHPNDGIGELFQLTSFAVDTCKSFLDKVLNTIRGTTLLLVASKAQPVGLYGKESVRSIARTAFQAPALAEYSRVEMFRYYCRT